MTSFTAADATAINQGQLAAEIGIAIAKKTLDHQRQQGQAALSLLDAARSLGPGPTGPSHPDKGHRIDVRG